MEFQKGLRSSLDESLDTGTHVDVDNHRDLWWGRGRTDRCGGTSADVCTTARERHNHEHGPAELLPLLARVAGRTEMRMFQYGSLLSNSSRAI